MKCRKPINTGIVLKGLIRFFAMTLYRLIITNRYNDTMLLLLDSMYAISVIVGHFSPDFASVNYSMRILRISNKNICETWVEIRVMGRSGWFYPRILVLGMGRFQAAVAFWAWMWAGARAGVPSPRAQAAHHTPRHEVPQCEHQYCSQLALY